MAVLGVGVDLVSVQRFATALTRTPSLADRLFSDTEREQHRVEQLAARFAAKEAVGKALGLTGLRWRDAEVRTGADGQPELVVTGTVAAAGSRLGVRHWHLSLSHDAGCAVAVVVVES